MAEVVQWTWVVVMMVVVEKQNVCLLMSCMCCSWQTPLMQLSIKREWWLSNIS